MHCASASSYTLFRKNPLILQYISNTPKLIQMKFTTDVTLKLQLKDTRHLIITAEL